MNGANARMRSRIRLGGFEQADGADDGRDHADAHQADHPDDRITFPFGSDEPGNSAVTREGEIKDCCCEYDQGKTGHKSKHVSRSVQCADSLRGPC